MSIKSILASIFASIALVGRLATIAFIGIRICSGGGGSTSVPTALYSGTAKATFVIVVPSKSDITTQSLNPKYISPSTRSITIFQGSNAGITSGLTPGSPNCVAATKTTPLTCTVTVDATVGSSVFSLLTHVSTDSLGLFPLSHLNVTETVVANVANNFPVTLKW